MSRTEQLSSETLVNTIKELEIIAEEVKNKQFIGLDSIVYHQNDSGAAYDWNGTLPSVGGGDGVKVFIIESTSLYQQSLFGDIIYELYKDSISPANKLNFVDEGVSVYEVTPVSDSNTSKKWAVYLSGDDTSTYFAKFYTITSTSASITIS